jgi:hypothetical protein
MEVLGLLVVLAGVLLLVTVAAIVPRYIFSPLDRAAKGRRHPVQFTLADFLCLFFLMQVSMGLGHSWSETRWTDAGWVITGYGWFAFGLLWLGHVRKLSLAGVHNGWHRSLCLVLVIPLGFAAAIAVPILAGGIVLALLDPVQLAERLPWLLLSILVETGLLAVVYALGRFTRHVVAAAAISAAEGAGTAREAAPGEGDIGGGPMVE